MTRSQFCCLRSRSATIYAHDTLLRVLAVGDVVAEDLMRLGHLVLKRNGKTRRRCPVTSAAMRVGCPTSGPAADCRSLIDD